MVQSQTKPMIFTRNPTPDEKRVGHSTRVALPISEQRQRLWYGIGRVMADMGKVIDEDEPMPEIEDEAQPEEVKPEETKPPKKENEESYFLRRLREIRAFLNRRAEIGEPLDEIATRPALDGIRGIRAGISADAMLHAMSLHWPADARREAGIREVDYADECEQLPAGEDDDGNVIHFHRLAGYVVKLANARIPIMLVGPAGTGKSHLLKQLAGLMDLPFAECPMTAGATPSWLLGKSTLQGFIESALMEVYSKGGVFNFEEIDAADPNMLLVSNQILASREYFNPANQEMYVKSDNFISASCANTFGLGATRAFTARERLDAASIDRWRMGRMFLPFDETLSEAIALAQ